MRGEAEPLKSPGLAVRGSAQHNVLLTLAHTPAHRLGGNLHTTLACGHPQSCVCDLVWVHFPQERASFLKFAFSRFLIPWRGQGALPLLPLPSWPRHPTPLRVVFKSWFMLTPARGRGGGVWAWETVPTAPPGCCVQICSKSKAQMPGEATGSFSLQKVLDSWLVQRQACWSSVGGLSESSGRA